MRANTQMNFKFKEGDKVRKYNEVEGKRRRIKNPHPTHYFVKCFYKLGTINAYDLVDPQGNEVMNVSESHIFHF